MGRLRAVAFFVLATVLVAAVALPTSANAAPRTTTTPVPTTIVVDIHELALVRQINTFRVRRGLPALRIDYKLQRAAEWMSLDMQRTASLDHVDSLNRQLVPRLAIFRYPIRLAAVGENIARGRTAANQTLVDWVRSPIHLAVLRDPRWRAIGIGRYCVVTEAGATDCWWTANFGGRYTQAMPPVTPAPTA